MKVAYNIKTSYVESELIELSESEIVSIIGKKDNIRRVEIKDGKVTRLEDNIEQKRN